MNRIFVGNLPFTTTDEEVKQLFAKNSIVVESAKIMTDRDTGRSRGFAFVTLPEGADVAKVIEDMNQTRLGGRTLTINEARPQDKERR